MSISIKNVSNEYITLFVRRDGVDIRTVIPAGQSLVADDHETKTMSIYKRRNIITVCQAQMFESDSFAFISETTESCDVTEQEVVKYIQDLPQAFKTSLEIIEGEVEQYIEDGYIKGEWTDEDIIFLKKNYPTKGRKYCSTHLNRNETSVQKKINSLGIKKKKKKK